MTGMSATPTPPSRALADPVLSARALSKSFFGVEVLKGVSIDLHAGQVHGLVG